MRLRSIRVENYRAIREASLTLDETTLLIGENDSGRTSIFEALVLILGAPEERFETSLKPMHFHRGSDSLRVELGFESFVFSFEAQRDPETDTITASWSSSAAASVHNDPELLESIRQLCPVLWSRAGIAPHANDPLPGPEHLADPLLARVTGHYTNLLSGNTPDLQAELEGGAVAAAAVIEKYPRLFAGASPVVSAMAAEVLQRPAPETPAAPVSSTPARKIGAILLLGGLLQLIRRNVQPDSHPVLVMDNPEANLHPMTMASVWRLLDRIRLQKIISTNSGTLLANAPLGSIRRLTRSGGVVREWAVPPTMLSAEDRRRVSYHVRSRRATAMFGRCWLFVEGETEFWVLPELAHVLGHDFGELGVVPVEFAQAGLKPLIKLAGALGIAWQLLADGDDAGSRYVATAEAAARNPRQRPAGASLIQLQENDIEHCFWHNGFDDVIRRIAYPSGSPLRPTASTSIRKAIERTSKPFLALSLIEAAAARGPASVPRILKRVIDAAVELATTGQPARH